MKKSITILLCAVMVISNTFFTHASSKLDDLQGQVTAQKREEQQYNAELKEIKSKEAQLTAEVNELNSEIGALKDDITVLEGQIGDKEAVIKTTQEELVVAKEDEATQYKVAKHHIKYMYENSRETYIQKLMEAKSISDLYKRIEYMKAMVSYDKEMFKNLEAVRIDIEDKEAVLQDELTALNTYNQDLSTQLAALDQKRVLKTSKMAELEKQESQIIDKKESLADSIAATQKLIKAEQQRLAELQYAGGEMAWPVPGYYRLSSPFGWRNDPFTGERWYHYGIDIPAPKGTKVVAANDGTVFYSGWIRGYGNTIMIAHGSGIVTLYGHNSSLVAKKGDVVKKGDIVAKVGSTGRSTGNHSHFEVRVNDKFKDPMSYLKK